MNYYRSIALLFYLLFFINGITQEPLPKGLTDEEKEVYEQLIRNWEYGVNVQPPAVPPRAPAEFEESGGLIITWAGFDKKLREVVFYTAGRGITIYIITDDPEAVQNYLIKGGVLLEDVHFVQIPFNSVWVRDYGPKSIYLAGNDELAFADWLYNIPRPLDNLVPENMANYLNLPVYQMTSGSNKLIHAGGNIMVDGHGTAFSSKLVLFENSSLTESQIDNIMYDFLGIDRYIKTEMLPYDYLHHLDMHMKLLDEETLLVGEYPEGVPIRPELESNLQYIVDNYKSCYGRPYNIIRIPMSPCPQGEYPPYANFRSYTNSLIINNVVLVPQYHNESLNAHALDIYKQAMPGYHVIGINVEKITYTSGAIHCITRGIAATDPVFISHAPIRYAEPGEKISIEAEIQNAAGISEANLFWRDNNKASYQQEKMIYQGGAYKADIPGKPFQTEISYYISATNNNEKTITKPLTAPDGTHTFTVGVETEVSHPKKKITFSVYPNPSEGTFNLVLPETNKTIDIDIIDMHGRIVYKNSVNNNDFNYSYPVNMKDEKPGIYMVRITWKQNRETEKLIII